MMNEHTRKKLHTWMEGEGVRAMMARLFTLGEIGMSDRDEAESAEIRTEPQGRTRLALDDADRRPGIGLLPGCGNCLWKSG